MSPYIPVVLMVSGSNIHDAAGVSFGRDMFLWYEIISLERMVRAMRRVLFICSQNRLRSPTAEHVFSSWLDMEVASAGIDPDCHAPVTPELLEWANLIFVMEQRHRTKLSKKFKRWLKDQRVIVLGIPDEYELTDPDLVDLLERKVAPHLG